MIPRRAALALPFLARTAHAAQWPDKPVRIIIPFGAGGPIDNIGRVLAEPLREALGQPFIIDNRPGAGGSIGLRAVVQAPPRHFDVASFVADTSRAEALLGWRAEIGLAEGFAGLVAAHAALPGPPARGYGPADLMLG